MPTNPILYNNGKMPSSTDIFKTAIDSKDYEQAIRILASVKALQTQTNILACCASAKLAFEVLKFVPIARKEPKVLALAATDLRVARLIIEDLPNFITDRLLEVAINGEEAWADRYQKRFQFSAAKRKKLLEGKIDKKRSTRSQRDQAISESSPIMSTSSLSSESAKSIHFCRGIREANVASAACSETLSS